VGRFGCWAVRGGAAVFRPLVVSEAGCAARSGWRSIISAVGHEQAVADGRFRGVQPHAPQAFVIIAEPAPQR
jgi:hypothetical protein